MRKLGRPEREELVVCEITRINPNSVYARLLEYKMSGMIHVSEVAKRWVRDIREFVKERQLVVCKVIRVEGNDISLSIKRVNRNQADRRLQEFKRERNAEKFLEQIAKQFKKSLDEAYDEVGHDLQDNFGSLNKTFEIALKNPELIKEKGIDAKWALAIIEIAQKNFVEKRYEVKAALNLKSYASDGVEVIKKALLDAADKGLDVKYISAPRYQITGRGKDIKKVRELVETACEDVVRAVKASGEASFALEGK
ncbi:MAG: S1 RNA-binding domain-containing protein [Candidatus Aenigmatarchaeota archaeon]|nr:MAG: S1 RNA-binding domain-containing protein [Candidatus Aenigmarchaeota archaeon]